MQTTYAEFDTCRIMAEGRFDEEKILPVIVLQRLKRENEEIACDRNLAAHMIKPYAATAFRAPLAPKIVLDLRRLTSNETERGQSH